MTSPSSLHFRHFKDCSSNLLGMCLLFIVLLVTALGIVWIMEWHGIIPCDLCLRQRSAYYYSLPLTGLSLWLIRSHTNSLLLPSLWMVIASMFSINTGLAAYHYGVEQNWWNSFSTCMNPIAIPETTAGLLESLDVLHLVTCEAPGFYLLGLSLSGWNAFLSFIMMSIAFHISVVSYKKTSLAASAPLALSETIS